MPNESLVIYSMNKVGRIVPPNKMILRDRVASLGFYYGAKIGVLGLNEAGKSTLLRIMTGGTVPAAWRTASAWQGV